MHQIEHRFSPIFQQRQREFSASLEVSSQQFHDEEPAMKVSQDTEKSNESDPWSLEKTPEAEGGAGDFLEKLSNYRNQMVTRRETTHELLLLDVTPLCIGVVRERSPEIEWIIERNMTIPLRRSKFFLFWRPEHRFQVVMSTTRITIFLRIWCTGGGKRQIGLSVGGSRDSIEWNVQRQGVVGTARDHACRTGH
jgi:hypothetical protein